MRFIIAGAILMATIAAHANHYTVYVGTYTRGPSEGIYALDYDSQTGELTNLRLAVETENLEALFF